MEKLLAIFMIIGTVIYGILHPNEPEEYPVKD